MFSHLQRGSAPVFLLAHGTIAGPADVMLRACKSAWLGVRLSVGLAILFPAMLQLRAADESVSEMVAALRLVGVGEVKAAELATALEKAEEGGSIVPLEDFLSDANVSVALASAIAASELDEGAAGRAIRERIAAKNGNVTALLIALCFVYEAENIQFLNARLGTETAEENRSAIEFSLRVLTRQNHSGAKAWNGWWKAHRDTFKPVRPEGIEEQQKRIHTAISILKAGKLRDVVAGLSKGGGKGAKALAGISELFSKVARALEEGQELHVSAEAKAADEFFSNGQLADAERAYAHAIEADPKDERSRFLRACLLFELGQLSEAAGEFASVSRTNEEATGARLLRAIAERRRGSPTAEPLLEAAVAEFHRLDPPAKVGLLGWEGDPILEMLATQTMAGAGIFHLESSRLDALHAREEADPEFAAGIALLRPRHERVAHLARAHERFPSSQLVLAALLQETIRMGSNRHREQIIVLAEKLAAADSENALPQYLLAHYRTFGKKVSDDYNARRKQPLVAEAVNGIEKANAQPRFSCYAEAAVDAQMRVLKETGHPFHHSLMNNRIEFYGPFLELIRRLHETAVADFEAGRHQQGVAICRATETLGNRFATGTGPLMQQLVGESAILIAHAAMRKRYEAEGELARAAELKASEERFRRDRLIFSRVSVEVLVLLPLPSLENALVERLVQDELGFLREQPAPKRAQAEVEDP